MTQRFKTLQVDHDEGSRWLTDWLAAGFDISDAVLASHPFDQGNFKTFISIEAPTSEIRFPHTPDVLGAVSDEGLAWFLEELIRAGARSLIVEDDMAERSDPKLPGEPIPSGFIDNRVIHWHDLGVGSGALAVEMIMRSASHIMNAFVSTKSVKELGFVDKEEIAKGVGEEIAASLLAIITFAFDETSFAVWDGR